MYDSKYMNKYDLQGNVAQIITGNNIRCLQPDAHNNINCVMDDPVTGNEVIYQLKFT